MKKLHILLFAVFTLASVMSLNAQSRDYNNFFYSPSADEDMKVIDTGSTFTRKGIQYGLVVTPVFLYEEADSYKLMTYLMNARIWAKSYLWSNSFLYVRLKDSYMGIITGEGDYSGLESDNLFDLDLAFLEMKSSAGAVSFSMGRKFYNIGTGLVLDGRGDGAELSLNSSLFSIRALGMYTGLMLKDNNPYGLSDKDFTDGAKRVFTGGEASLYFLNQTFYVFGLAQVDLSDQDAIQKTEYNSQYYGSGLRGVILESASYYAEFVYETGKGYAPGNAETDIRACAVNSGIDWYLPVALRPVLMLQYAFGSGDENRSNYTTANMQGVDNRDNGFMSFGTYSGGYAFKPVLGNMHVLRAGASFVPFADSSSARFSRMSLMAKYSYYLKDVKESSVNAGEGGRPEAFLGQEVDASLRWQVYYDLSCYVNYGIFLPGSAFASGTGETQFVMAGVNLSF